MSFACAKTEINLPANKRSEERSAGDAQCPDSQCGTTVLGREHLLQVCCAKGQRGTDAEALENPSDHNSPVRLGNSHAASRDDAYGKRDQQNRSSPEPIGKRVPEQDTDTHHQRVGTHEVGNVVNRLVEKPGNREEGWDERRGAPGGHSSMCGDLEDDEVLD